jgi:hypothetical protein
MRNKGDAYRRLQARNSARREAFKIHLPGDESTVSYLKTLAAYVSEAIDKTIKGGLHFRFARVKPIVVRSRLGSREQWEVRNRGRIYHITVEDMGPITGVSTDDIEYGGPASIEDDEDYQVREAVDEEDCEDGVPADPDDGTDTASGDDEEGVDDGDEQDDADCPNPNCMGTCNVCGYK